MAASGVQDISIHAPAKGATTISPSSDVMQSFQSTLPRRERPIDLQREEKLTGISIHAPAKGATGGATVKYTRYCGISIHAPAKGATKRKPTADQQTDHFNPRSREGSDLQVAKSNPANQGISIHAPAKGATHRPRLVRVRQQISIHAPAKGATPQVVPFNSKVKFQSTLPRRERPFIPVCR